MSAVNGVSSSVHPGSLISPSPALVLDDACITERDFSKCAMGKVKDFNSIPNLQTILVDEGFEDVNLFYLGGKWVMFEFDKVDTKRVVWVDIEGIPLHALSRDTFTRIGNKWGETLNIEDTIDSSFGRKRLCISTKHPVSILESFKIIAKGKVFMVRTKELFTWNPIFLPSKEKAYSSDDESAHCENSKEEQSHVSEEEEGEFNTSDVEGVSKMIFGENSTSSKKHNKEVNEQHFEDPVELYELLNKRRPRGDTKFISLRCLTPWIPHQRSFVEFCGQSELKMGGLSWGLEE
ncbi:hypothetical protein Tco_0963572 [Tanacetum coccineum]